MLDGFDRVVFCRDIGSVGHCMICVKAIRIGGLVEVFYHCR